MKVSFVCPFNLDRLTGTPIRTRSTINSVSNFSKSVFVISENSSIFNDNVIFKNVRKNFTGFVIDSLKLLKEYNPDVLHGVSTLSVFVFICYKIFFNKKTKFIFEVHGWSWFETRGILPIYKRLTLLVLDILGVILANYVISMSFTQKTFLKKYFRKKDIGVIWGPVDFKIIFNEPNNREVFKIGYLGNDSFWQGLPILVDTAEKLLNYPKIEFNLAGFDFNSDHFFKKLPNIKYVGKIHRKDVPGFMKDMDILVSPRIKSNVSNLQYPQKLSEYVSSSRVVLVSDVNDQKFIINKAKCGFIIGNFDPNKIADQIIVLSEMSYEERNSLSKNAYNFAKSNFSKKVFNKKIRLVYDSLQ